MLPYVELRALFARNRLKLSHCDDYFAHIARYEYHAALLSAGGAQVAPGRFHAQGGAPALYFAESPVTALVEVEALLGSEPSLTMNKRPPLVLVNVRVVIPNGVLDLTEDESNRELLGTTYQELTGSWIYDDDPPTQRLGRAAYDSNKIVAIRYPSGKWRGETLQRNLVVFRNRLTAKRGALLQPYDPDSTLPPTVHSVPVRPLPGRRR